MIRLTPDISIADDEIQIEFVRSSGPGGQNVNKVATAAQLRFDVIHSPSLPPDVRNRLIQLAGSRITSDGILLLDARRFRSQSRNREDALERLADLVRQAAVRPRRRRKTVPSKASRQRRLDAKRHRGQIKHLRGTTED